MKQTWCSVGICALLVLATSGNLWGGQQPASAANDLRPQARLTSRPSQEPDEDLQKSKRERFKMLEYVIMQDLLEKYQKLEKNELSADDD